MQVSEGGNVRVYRNAYIWKVVGRVRLGGGRGLVGEGLVGGELVGRRKGGVEGGERGGL